MNPQQFQNMGGMGRGMPNGNIQQQQQQQQQQLQLQQQQMNNTNAGLKLQQYIIQSLNGDGPFQGWQADVPIAERAQRVKLLVDSLRLLGPGAVEMSRAVDVALNFERKEFTQQPSREDYHRECADKLSKIRDQRQQTAVKMTNMGGQGQAMPIMNPAFQQQMQQMNRNINMPQHMQQPGMQPAPMMNQQFGQQNVMQNMNPQMNAMRPNMQRGLGQPPLTTEDNSIINLRAAELARRTPKEEMQAIIESMDPALKQNCIAKGIEPIAYHFRVAATREFRLRQSGAANGNMNQQMNNNFGMMNQMTGGQQGVNNTMMNQNQPQPQQAAGTPFLSNIDQLRGQQEAALQLQAEGQMVVPASNNQNTASDQIRMQQLTANQQRMVQQNQAKNAQLIGQQQAMNANQNQQQQRLQAAQQLQQQAQNQARNEAAAAQGNMQNVGQAQNPMQGMGQANPMQMLNRPMGPGLSGTSPQPPRPASRAPMPGQQLPAGQQPVTAPQIQNREQFLAQFPPQLQTILRQKPTNEWSAIVGKFRNQSNMRRSASQQPGGPQQGQQGPQQPFLGGANINNVGPPPMQQSLSAGPPVNPQSGQMSNSIPNITPQQQNAQLAANQDMIRQRQLMMQQQQAQQARMNGQAPPANGADLPKRPLNPQEMAVMDQQQVHPQLLRQVQHFVQLSGGFAPEIKSWVQLKQWLAMNPTPKFPPQSILQVQAGQFHFQMRQRQQQQQQQQNQQQNQQQSQQQQMQLQHNQQQQRQQLIQQQQQQLQQNQQQQQLMQQQQNNTAGQMPNMPPNMPQNQGAGQGMPAMRPITDQDILKIRQHNPKTAAMTDDQIRQTLLARQRQAQEQQANKLQMMQRTQQQQLNAQQQQGQQAVPMQQQLSQISNQAGQPQQPNPAMQRPASARPMPQAPQANGGVQPEHKNLKRPNDDGGDVPQTQTRPMPADQMRGVPNLTKEQFEKLDPMKQRQYMDMKRRQEIMRRIADLSKEVQSAMPPLRPITNMDANSRKRITTLLTLDSTKNLLAKFDSFLVGYYMVEKDDQTLKQLMNQRNHLIAQYKPQALANKIFEPNDYFSITAENVESIVGNITTKFQQTSAKYGKNNQQQPVPLTAENLSLAQAQAAQQQKKGQKAKDAPPPAPTGEKPPFQLGDNRGHGTPTYAPAPSLKQEDLKLDPKRRKKNPPATPATATTASPEIVKEQKAVPKVFKCTSGNCQNQNRAFANQAALDEHVKSAHQRPEIAPVTDAVGFLAGAAREVFDLDENFRPKAKDVAIASTSQAMQKSISKAGSNLKLESKPSTPVPMARGVSQQTGKAGAPSTPSMLKTPQSLQDGVKAATPKGPEVSQELVSWDNSKFTLTNLKEAFGNFEWGEIMPSLDPESSDLNGVLRNYMQSEEWQNIMSGGSSDEATDKSKSPDQGSEPSAPGAEAAAQKSKKQKDDIDLIIDGLDMAEGFEDLIMSDSLLMGQTDGDWELTERPSPQQDDKVMTDANNPFASDADPDLMAWRNAPLDGFDHELDSNGFPDPESMSPFLEINIDDWIQSAAPNAPQPGNLAFKAGGVKNGLDVGETQNWPTKAR